MTFTIEDGTGVRRANSYMSVQQFRDWHAERGVDVTGLSDATVQQLLIKGTDYIETRWGPRFKGVRRFRQVAAVAATGTLTLTGLPLAAETVTLGTTVYTFVASLTAANDVLIGANASDSLDNLIAAIAAGTGEGTLYGTGTTANPDVTAEAGAGDTATITASTSGDIGNLIASSETLTNGSFGATYLSGGFDLQPQPLSFPRSDLYDRDGIQVTGIPWKLRGATAEYAYRANSVTLAPDGSAATAGIKKLREKAGPLEQETEYFEGSEAGAETIDYPPGDRLLADYVFPSGGAYR